VDYPLYRNHDHYQQLLQLKADNDLKPVEKIIMVCTQRSFENSKDKITKWIQVHEMQMAMEFHYLEDMVDINSESDARAMRNLIYNLVYLTRLNDLKGDLYLCLSGGRKTMSSDIQQAANIFGCKAMLHVLAEGIVNFELESEPGKIPKETINRITPVVYQTKLNASYLSELIRISTPLFTLQPGTNSEISHPKTETGFLELVERLQEQQDNLAINYYHQLRFSEASTNFQALHLLKPEAVAMLKHGQICEADLGWIYSLPKTDLHCHLGGIADCTGLVKLAQANRRYYENQKSSSGEEKLVGGYLERNDINALRKIANGLLGLDRSLRWVKVSNFLSAFEGREPLLEELVYGDYQSKQAFCAIGLENYEKLGDFQGSTLLQSEEALRTAAKLLKTDAERNNLIYKELRCSPGNYTERLTSREVIEILWDEFKNHSCIFKLILIGSRHRSLKALRDHVKLCKELKSKGGKLGEFICGFDLAGSEGMVEPQELRSEILPLLEACIRITIHAGETTQVEDIWKAIYHLNADRIGHGLSLVENYVLLQKLKDQRTAIELCPSSNFQISGFRDYQDSGTLDLKQYPLKQYLKEGIKACICTDDPGISLTDISQEYLQASRLSDGGISKWELLILLRNSYVSAFLPLPEKQNLIRMAESQILESVQTLCK